MDHIQTSTNTTKPRRHRSLTDILTILERGIRSIRGEMSAGLQVDEQIVSELEARVERLKELESKRSVSTVDPGSSNRR